jgi:hypothetical protein
LLDLELAQDDRRRLVLSLQSRSREEIVTISKVLNKENIGFILGCLFLPSLSGENLLPKFEELSLRYAKYQEWISRDLTDEELEMITKLPTFERMAFDEMKYSGIELNFDKNEHKKAFKKATISLSKEKTRLLASSIYPRNAVFMTYGLETLEHELGNIDLSKLMQILTNLFFQLSQHEEYAYPSNIKSLAKGLDQALNTDLDPDLEMFETLGGVLAKEIALGHNLNSNNFIIDRVGQRTDYRSLVGALVEFRDDNRNDSIPIKRLLHGMDSEVEDIGQQQDLELESQTLRSQEETVIANPSIIKSRMQDYISSHPIDDLLRYRAASLRPGAYGKRYEWIDLPFSLLENDPNSVIDQYKPYIAIGLTPHDVQTLGQDNINPELPIPKCFKDESVEYNYALSVFYQSQERGFKNATLLDFLSKVDIANSNDKVRGTYTQMLVDAVKREVMTLDNDFDQLLIHRPWISDLIPIIDEYTSKNPMAYSEFMKAGTIEFFPRFANKLITMLNDPETEKIVITIFLDFYSANVDKILEDGYYNILKALGVLKFNKFLISNLNPPELDKQKIIEAIINSGNVSDLELVTIGDRVGIDYNQKAVELVQRYFGKTMNYDLYELFNLMLNDPWDPRLKDYGIKIKPKNPEKSYSPEDIDKLSKEAIRQFDKFIAVTRAEFVRQDFRVSEIVEDKIKSKIFKSFINYDQSQFSGQHRQTYDDKIATIIAQEGVNDKLGVEFKVSRPYDIKSYQKIDMDSDMTFSAEFQSHLERLKGAYQHAVDAIDSPLSYKKMIIRTQRKVAALLQLSQTKLHSTPEQYRPPLLKKIEMLESIDLLNLDEEGFREAVGQLYSQKEFKSELLALVFYLALINHPEERSNLQEAFLNDVSSYSHLMYINDFISHIANEESWKKELFYQDTQNAQETSQNKVLENNYKGIVNLDYMQSEVAIAQSKLGLSTRELVFVPSRGPLLEFSGEMADSCWTGKYKSIAQEKPNFTAVTIVEDFGQPEARAAGSCMLIETTNEKKEKILIIRGLNPKQSIIDGLDAESFVKQYIHFVRTIAKSTESKLCIVFDDCGKASTNRPTVYFAIKKIINPMKKAKLENPDEVEFNEYPIINDIYYI